MAVSWVYRLFGRENEHHPGSTARSVSFCFTFPSAHGSEPHMRSGGGVPGEGGRELRARELTAVPIQLLGQRGVFSARVSPRTAQRKPECVWLIRPFHPGSTYVVAPFFGQPIKRLLFRHALSRHSFLDVCGAPGRTRTCGLGACFTGPATLCHLSYRSHNIEITCDVKNPSEGPPLHPSG